MLVSLQPSVLPHNDFHLKCKTFPPAPFGSAIKIHPPASSVVSSVTLAWAFAAAYCASAKADPGRQ